MKNSFIFDSRLGIRIPDPQKARETCSREEMEDLLFQWELIKGAVPDRIKEIEMQIHVKQEQLSREPDFEISCRLNTEISELASIINNLWLCYRADAWAAKLHH
ncbi:hypothetical protein JOC77_002319 [Peribacillus deserti]|uniref:DUF4391 domain-containing protein n=1 Tax=Peribacillus deserti TaxID=673318 RepID=A0ABS2QK76_9BACI|nr:hypothetical protein [Peribacillus deserti]